MLGDVVPNEGNLRYCDGRQHTKKGLTTGQNMDAMYVHFQGKTCINLWCDIMGTEASDDGMPAHVSKENACAKRRGHKKGA